MPLPLRAASAYRAPLPGRAGHSLLPHSHHRHQARSHAKPKIVKVIEAETIAARTGYSRPHTVHCGPDGIFVSALGAPNGDGPGGIFVIDPESFDILGKWEIDRGPQYLGYDFWWHLGYDTLITSEWGTPNMVKHGVNPEILLKGGYGHSLHVWDLRKRRHVCRLSISAQNNKWCWSSARTRSRRPTDLSAWLFRSKISPRRFGCGIATTANGPSKKLSKFPLNPPILTIFRRCSRASKLSRPSSPTLIFPSMIVSSTSPAGAPANSSNTMSPIHFIQDLPAPCISVELSAAPRTRKRPRQPLNGGPQMVEVSRDGQRIYFTNSLYAPWDEQFYPDGIRSWMVKLDAKPEGGIALDPKFFLEFDDLRSHQVHLEGGDASSDSYCYS